MKWTEDELRASVAAYLEMLALWREGKPYVKKQWYRDLAARFGRTYPGASTGRLTPRGEAQSR